MWLFSSELERARGERERGREGEGGREGVREREGEGALGNILCSS